MMLKIFKGGPDEIGAVSQHTYAEIASSAKKGSDFASLMAVIEMKPLPLRGRALADRALALLLGKKFVVRAVRGLERIFEFDVNGLSAIPGAPGFSARFAYSTSSTKLRGSPVKFVKDLFLLAVLTPLQSLGGLMARLFQVKFPLPESLANLAVRVNPVALPVIFIELSEGFVVAANTTEFSDRHQNHLGDLPNGRYALMASYQGVSA